MRKRDSFEISDLIVDIDLSTFQRRPVSKAAVMERLVASGQLKASHVV